MQNNNDRLFHWNKIFFLPRHVSMFYHFENYLIGMGRDNINVSIPLYRFPFPVQNNNN